MQARGVCKPGHGVRHGLGIGEEHGFVRAQHQHARRAFGLRMQPQGDKIARPGQAAQLAGGGLCKAPQRQQQRQAHGQQHAEQHPQGQHAGSGGQRHPGVTVPAQRGPQRARPQLVRDDADHDRAQHRQGQQRQGVLGQPQQQGNRGGGHEAGPAAAATRLVVGRRGGEPRAHGQALQQAAADVGGAQRQHFAPGIDDIARLQRQRACRTPGLGEQNHQQRRRHLQGAYPAVPVQLGPSQPQALQGDGADQRHALRRQRQHGRQPDAQPQN